MVSRSMNGSAPGLPFPTRPGHIALWSLGKLLPAGTVEVGFLLMVWTVYC